METVIEVKDLDEAKLHVGKKAYAIGQNLAYFIRHNEKPRRQDGRVMEVELRSPVTILDVKKVFGRIRYDVTDGFVTVQKEPQNLILQAED